MHLRGRRATRATLALSQQDRRGSQLGDDSRYEGASLAMMGEKAVLPPGDACSGWVVLWLIATALALSGCGKTAGPPAVECVIDYGGESYTSIVRPTSDPYRVKPLKIGDAFEFKAVYVATPPAVAALSFYVYDAGERGPVLIEQTKYRPPLPRNSSSSSAGFTGIHYVYGLQGEELVYTCRRRSP